MQSLTFDRSLRERPSGEVDSSHRVFFLRRFTLMDADLSVTSSPSAANIRRIHGVGRSP